MLRHALALALALAGAALAGPASAEPPAPQRHGAYCTPAGCPGRTASPAGFAAGFALALVGAAGLRRRDRTG